MSEQTMQWLLLATFVVLLLLQIGLCLVLWNDLKILRKNREFRG